MGGSPDGRDGADILAFDVGDSLLFEAATAKGEAFMKQHSGLLGKATKAQRAAGDKQASEAQKMVPAVDVSGIAEKLRAGFDSAIWEEIARR